MKAITSYGLSLPQVRVSVLSVMVYVCIIVFLVFSAVNVKFQSIRTGYDINNLAKKNQELSIKLQSLEIEKSKLVDKRILYLKGEQRGFMLPEADKVYYVE